MRRINYRHSAMVLQREPQQHFVMNWIRAERWFYVLPGERHHQVPSPNPTGKKLGPSPWIFTVVQMW